eukprot:CAMPEP_0183737060 /NCGR_PEP_ID=MMETSP0737-20130205/50980_1 /TAXON_ID=385413 /ORGANISM="Thalassiosira miniscula, Strain CCMP1093" /LENGTH=59 /DNA_ID=CAMNT_0025971255 /DNA_START=19 /DNA_END=199 /DNA_ORIENTATION=-
MAELIGKAGTIVDGLGLDTAFLLSEDEGAVRKAAGGIALDDDGIIIDAVVRDLDSGFCA